MNVAYLGPDGSYGSLAFKQLVRVTKGRSDGHAYKPVVVGTNNQVLDCVSAGRAHVGLVPIRNTTVGKVVPVMTALAEEDCELAVLGEVKLPVKHSLYCHPQYKDSESFSDFVVATHPQAHAQCHRTLRGMGLHRYEEFASTSGACEAVVSHSERKLLAIGSVNAGVIYNLHTIRTMIHDYPKNATIFYVVASRKREIDLRVPATRPNTPMIITLNCDGHGVLLSVLQVFEVFGVNITGLTDLPYITGPRFYLEAEIGPGKDLESMLVRLRTRCDVRVLGSYAC